jgi:hypothetical protein
MTKDVKTADLENLPANSKQLKKKKIVKFRVLSGIVFWQKYQPLQQALLES